MRQFEIRLLVSVAQMLGQLEVLVYKQDLYPDKDATLKKTRDDVGATLQKLLGILDSFDLPYARAQVERIVSNLERYPNHKELSDQFGVLVDRITDELDQKPCYLIAAERVKFYNGRHLFGEDVDRAFPSAMLDIEEAGKCYAVGRGTACVFHLMRVMEVGLRALATSLNDVSLDPKTNPTWERILSRGDKELQKPLKDRAEEWRVDDLFFSTATANLRAVKDAWRNSTMHVEISYDDERAFDVWNAVRAFMRHLARKLTDVKNGLPSD